MSEQQVYEAALIGCGRMGTTIDDEVRDNPNSQLPYSHAAGHTAADRVELVAAADIDDDQLENAQQRYDIPRGYEDYREMIDTEEPDILSVATTPAPHADMVTYAAENGVPAIYCEKPLCRSKAEADRMVEACQANDVHFNLGVNRRFRPMTQQIRELVRDGAIGDVEAITLQTGASAALWGHTHSADLLLYFAEDEDVSWVQGESDFDDDEIEDNRIGRDPPVTMGYIHFADGVRGYLTQGGGYELEIAGTEGKIRTFNDGASASLRQETGEWGLLEEQSFPEVEHESGTLRCINELVTALDGEGTTSAPVESSAAGQEVCLGWVLSHYRDGARVELPLDGDDREFLVTRE